MIIGVFAEPFACSDSNMDETYALPAICNRVFEFATAVIPSWALASPFLPFPLRWQRPPYPSRAEPFARCTAVQQRSPSPAGAMSYKGKASSSSGDDPEWLQCVRIRHLEARLPGAASGDDRWASFEASASAYRALPAVQEAMGSDVTRQEHQLLRTDLSSGLAIFEPQADTMIVEGRPTQVAYPYESVW